MKEKFFTLIIILIFITIISIYVVCNYRNNIIASQKVNNEYKSYYNVEILGTDLISIINKTIDYNEKNNISKDSKNHYIDNEENSIQIEIKFLNNDKTFKMESISAGGTESFIKNYNTATFKCTNIEEHKDTKNVKKLLFEQIN